MSQTLLTISPGWNLLSVDKAWDGLPVDELCRLFPEIAPQAWQWHNGLYQPADTLVCYEGRWVFSASQTDIYLDPNEHPLLYLVIDLSAGPSAPNYPVSYLCAVPPGGWTDEYKTTRIVLRRIPAGTFTMGSPDDELGREDNEQQHQVTLTRDFYMGVFEVTQKQYERVMGTWPSYFNNASCRDARPVEKVSYYDIRENPANTDDPAVDWPYNTVINASSFMGRLRQKTTLPLDLPTEAQWEYACRAGTTTALNSGKNLTAEEQCQNMAEVGRYWYNGGSGYYSGGDTSVGSAQVGTYLPNAWGLYDMHGNVWEWCLDWSGTYPGTVTDPVGADTGSWRVFRGGGWSDYFGAQYSRSASRGGYLPDRHDYNKGFRVCSAPPSQ